MTGKEKCILLRQIRKEIAETNGIAYFTTECTYEGNDCLGTCPKCDEEIAYLDAELNRKIAEGKLVTISGISLNTLQTAVPSPSRSDGFDRSPSFTMGEMVIEKGSISQSSKLNMTIEELDLSVRAYNCCKRANILTVGDLIKKTGEDMMKVRNMGKKSLDEIQKKLEMMGLSLLDCPEEEDEDEVPIDDIVCGGLTFIETDEDKLQITLEDLDFSVRTYNVLKRAYIDTVGELINRNVEDLMKIRNMGKKSMDEIIGKVHNLGLRFLDESFDDFSDGCVW
jgi:DNA-directed RNA polymerase alpha subunit